MSEDADDAGGDDAGANADAEDGRRHGPDPDAGGSGERRIGEHPGGERATEPASRRDDVAQETADGDEVFAELGDAHEGDADDLFDRLGEPGAEDPFEDLGVETLPEEDVWADEDGGSVDADSIVPEVQESAPDLDVPTGEKEAVVDKRRYCESCEYFSEPPEVACSHSGTEIRELVDVDHFKVYACPIVAKRRGLGWYEEE
jgi:hypothetical protein